METDQKLLDTTFGSILYGPVFMIQSVVPHMPRGGRIINIGSATAKMGTPSMPIYATAKAALDCLTYSISMEVCPVSLSDISLNIECTVNADS
jgi:NAD(P)-dependent dehydrogenase (short-subunit alcohol dehydrogenase family)